MDEKSGCQGRLETASICVVRDIVLSGNFEVTASWRHRGNHSGASYYCNLFTRFILVGLEAGPHALSGMLCPQIPLP